jgi:NAD(P)-dependent dehydrogenase (short-subunit alcohol dehydrogenase family)
MDAQPRRVVITGANRGLGLGFVEQCLARGDRVWGACRRPQEAVALRTLGPAGILALDVDDEASVEAFGRALARETDGVDLLVNNAGLNASSLGADPARRGVLEIGGTHFLGAVRTNALGPMLVTRALLPLLRGGLRPVVVNISSKLGSLSFGAQMLDDVGYNASKAALNMITTALAGTLGPEGIVVLSVHPGWVRTDMGGPAAPLSVQESVSGVLSALDDLAPEANGGFLDWTGAPHPW